MNKLHECTSEESSVSYLSLPLGSVWYGVAGKSNLSSMHDAVAFGGQAHITVNMGICKMRDAPSSTTHTHTHLIIRSVDLLLVS